MRFLTALMIPALALCLASALDAQAVASAERENFQVLPMTLAGGAQNVTLRLSGAKSDLFSSSSKTAPTVVFGTGVQLVPGSFRILNAAEAEVRVNVQEGLVAGVPLTITFFAPDGVMAVRQEKATLSVVGPVRVGANNNPINVSVSRVNLVRVNVGEAQSAGDIILSGRVNGAVSLEAPTGTLFAAGTQPSVVGESGNVTTTNPRMNAERDTFSFSIANAALAEVQVRIGNISYDTSNFTSLSGALGTLSALVTNTQVGTEPLLVPNAHTAQVSLEGDAVPQPNAPPSTAPAPTETEAPATATPTSSSGASNFRDTGRSSNRSGTGGASNAGGSNPPQNRGATTLPAGGVVQPPRPNTPRPPTTGSFSGGSGSGVASNPGPAPSGSAPSKPGASVGGARDKPKIAEGGIPAAFSDGSNIRNDSEDADSISRQSGRQNAKTGASDDKNEGTSEAVVERDASELPDYRDAPSRRLVQSQRLYFSDRDGNRLSSVVLDRAIADEKSARVWIVLERTDISEAVDTVEVRIHVGDERRTLVLTETGATTGVFKSSDAGIELKSLHTAR